MLRQQTFTFGPFRENTYLLWNDHDLSCLIIDPGCSNRHEETELFNFLTQNHLVPKYLVNTHAHIDHILGNKFIFDKFGLKPILHPADLPLLLEVERVGKMYNIPVEASPEPERFFTHNSTEQFCGFEFNIRHTPGHSPGSVCLIQNDQKWVIAGDVLFAGSIGRTDLPGGNHEQLLTSIRSQLLTLSDDFQVFPGHGTSTTIKAERFTNPFLN